MLALALCLSGCGGGAHHRHQTRPEHLGVGVHPKVIDVYSGLPLHGQYARQGAALVDGIKLALAQSHGYAGPFRVNYVSLNDTTETRGGTAARIEANARRAAADTKSILYIGDFTSGATEVALPILNEADLPQINPASTYVGLTTAEPGAASGDPSRYQPTGKPTFVRIVPRDTVEVVADLLAMKQAGCTKVAVAHDGSAYGIGLATELEALRHDYGLTLLSAPDPGPSALRAYAIELKTARVDCLFNADASPDAAVPVTDSVHAAIATAKLFGPHPVCTGDWTNARDGGVVQSADKLIQCTSVTYPVFEYPGTLAHQFLAAYRARYGAGNPDAHAIYGYEAMKLGLNTIAALGARGDDRAAVVAALFAKTDRQSVLGTYHFDHYGDTTLKTFGLYKVGASGNPEFLGRLTPDKAP